MHGLDERLQVFWVLSASKLDPDTEFQSATAISEILRDVCAIHIARQNVVAILSTERRQNRVAVKRKGKKSYFKLMKLGEDELTGAGLKPLFVDPRLALSSIRAVENVLEALQGEIRICDPYIYSKTLDYIALTSKAEKVFLLTENIQDSSRLRRDLAAFTREHQKLLEIRVMAAGNLHDRYILHRDGMLFVGASLKDIAKKQSMIISLPASMATEIGKTFERGWNSANKFS